VTGEILRRAPLASRGADLGRMAGLTSGRVAAVDVSELVQVSLRLDPVEAVGSGSAVATLPLGIPPLTLPLEPNTTVGNADRGALWLGPNEWLLVDAIGALLPDEAGPTPSLVRELEAALSGTHHSVVDVSGGRAVIQLSGPGRLELLSSICPLDLHPRVWEPGRCAQTVVGRAQALLQELPDATRVFVRPSFAHYMVDLLLDAASAP